MTAVLGCPNGYDEVFAEYFPMMRGIVAKSMITPDDVEDVAMDILLRFIQKDGLNYFDLSKVTIPGTEARVFRGMLKGFTATYVMQYRDKQMTRHRREPWRNETPVVIKGTRDPVSWLEANFSETTSWELLDAEVAVDIRNALLKAKAVLAKKTTKHRDYAAFVTLCIEQGFLDGKLDRKAIQSSLGVSAATVTDMLKELKKALRPLLSEVGVVAEVA